MKEPYYLADEKELFKKIFKMSDRLTRELERSRSEWEAHPKKQKLNGGPTGQTPDTGEYQTPPVSN